MVEDDSKGVVRQQDGKPKDARINMLCILSRSERLDLFIKSDAQDKLMTV